MTRFNRWWVAAIVLAGFFWLAHYSREEQGYTHSVFDVLSLTQRQATALKAVYGLSDEDAAMPVRLWGN